MRVIFKETDGDYLEAIIVVNGEPLIVMDEFGGESLKSGDVIDVELCVGLHYEEESWESMFSSNPESQKNLEHQSGWSYRAYGIITSLEPEVLVDVGFAELEAPISTTDERVIGENIAFTISRLDAFSS